MVPTVIFSPAANFSTTWLNHSNIFYPYLVKISFDGERKEMNEGAKGKVVIVVGSTGSVLTMRSAHPTVSFCV